MEGGRCFDKLDKGAPGRAHWMWRRWAEALLGLRARGFLAYHLSPSTVSDFQWLHLLIWQFLPGLCPLISHFKAFLPVSKDPSWCFQLILLIHRFLVSYFFYLLKLLVIPINTMAFLRSSMDMHVHQGVKNSSHPMYLPSEAESNKLSSCKHISSSWSIFCGIFYIILCILCFLLVIYLFKMAFK